MIAQSKQLICAILLLSITIQIEAGFLDWFRSKPKWAKLIEKYPLIEAFSPRGLRVSISDIVGMEVFGFHGNVNQCFKRGEEGVTYGNVTKPTNGRWVYIDENIELKPDDALHYWIYVKMNGEEYSFSKDIYVIKSLAPLPGNLKLINFIDERIDKSSNGRLSENSLQNGEKWCPCPEEPAIYSPVPYNPNTPNSYDATIQPTPYNSPQPYQPPIPTYQPRVQPISTNVPSSINSALTPRFDDNTIPPGSGASTKPIIYEHESSANAAELLACSFQVDSLNEVILDLLKDHNMTANLVLVGKIDEEQGMTTAMEDVHKILVNYLELYDLGKKIKKAEYKNCGIYFEMSSIIDKQRILLRAKTDMRNVPCKFLEPEVAGC